MRFGFSNGEPRSIRFWIFLLFGLIVVPQLALLVWVGMKIAAFLQQDIRQQRAAITTAVAARIDLEIANALGTLKGIAGTDIKMPDQLAQFRNQAVELAKRPTIRRIWAFDRSGAVLAGTVVPDAEPPPRAIPASMIAAAFEGESAVSGVYGRGSSDSYVILAVPAWPRDRRGHGIAAEVRIAHLSHLFADAGMKANWPAAVIDRDGKFVARSLAAAERLGRPARPALVAVARSGANAGVFENVTYEGVRSQNLFERSRLTGWTTIVAVPSTEMSRPVRLAVALLVLGGLVMLVVTLLFARLLTARIVEPVQSLSAFARALVDGKAAPQPSHRLAELEVVRAELERTMAQSARLAAIVGSSGDAILSMDLAGTIQTWNGGAEALFGFTAEAAIGRSKRLIVPDHELEEFQAELESVQNGKGVRRQTQRRHKDGHLIDVLIDVAPIRRPDGTVIGVSSVIHDITDRKRGELHRELLTKELAHRCKNQLAIIQSIGAQTAKHTGSAHEFMVAFRQRLRGLAASHELLACGGWEGVALEDLVREHAEVFLAWPSPQLRVHGPHVMLEACAAEALGLAMHELMTNAAKYGALTVPDGRIDIAWELKTRSDGIRGLEFSWRERGHPVTAPTHTGFGTVVIETLVPSKLGGEAQLEYRPDGLEWVAAFPLTSAAIDQASASAAVAAVARKDPILAD